MMCAAPVCAFRRVWENFNRSGLNARTRAAQTIQCCTPIKWDWTDVIALWWPIR
jgi:hypothetical protein